MGGLFLLVVTVVFIWLAVSATIEGKTPENPVDALQLVSGFCGECGADFGIAGIRAPLHH